MEAYSAAFGPLLISGVKAVSRHPLGTAMAEPHRSFICCVFILSSRSFSVSFVIFPFMSYLQLCCLVSKYLDFFPAILLILVYLCYDLWAYSMVSILFNPFNLAETYCMARHAICFTEHFVSLPKNVHCLVVGWSGPKRQSDQADSRVCVFCVRPCDFLQLLRDECWNLSFV